MKNLITILLLCLPAFGQVTSTKTVTITVSGTTQTIADNKAERIIEDYVVGTLPALIQPAQVVGGACASITNDIYQREAANAVAPLVPCAVRTNTNGSKRLLPTATLETVFQRLVRRHVQAVVKDRRTVDAAETARKAVATAADEVEPN